MFRFRESGLSNNIMEKTIVGVHEKLRVKA